jgi:hypothetical protein
MSKQSDLINGTFTDSIDVTGTVVADGLTVDGVASLNADITQTSVSPSFYIMDSNTTDLNDRFVNAGGTIFLQTVNDAKSTFKSRFSANNSTGDISFYEDTGTTAKLFWDASAESLGIGTSSPSAKLDVAGPASITSFTGTTELGIVVQGSTGATDYSGIDFKGNSQVNPVARIGVITTGSGSKLSFGTSNNYVSGITNTAMTIDSSGNLNLAKTASSMTVAGCRLGANGGSEIVTQGNNITALKIASTDDAYIALVDFYTAGGTYCGYILGNGSATSYMSNSDYRLKENIVDLTGATERLKQLPVRRFNFINNPSKTVDGFLAHEAQAVVPEAVHGTKDAMRDEEYEVTAAVLDADGMVVTEAVMGTRSVPDMQGIDQSKLVPLLTAALQEALNKIDAMEIRLAALEAN